MKILHVFRHKNDPYPLEIARLQAAGGEHQVSVVLLQDAVLDPPRDSSLRVMACREDAEARGVDPGVPLVDYEEIVDRIFEADRVVNW